MRIYKAVDIVEVIWRLSSLVCSITPQMLHTEEDMYFIGQALKASICFQGHIDDRAFDFF